MDNFLPSELILNEDLSVYHLCLLPHQIADIIITVGDPNRVTLISQHFDSIEYKVANREFVTHTGYIGKKRLSVLSTGIGVDNIDIVFNELDILSAIDLKSKSLKKEKRTFKVIRLGTTGSICDSIQINDILFSKYAIGIDGVPYHYQYNKNLFENELSETFSNTCHWSEKLALPYAVKVSDLLWDKMYDSTFKEGITLTMNGFYAPQGRQLRVPLYQPNILKDCQKIRHHNYSVTNLEMETAGLYAFGKIFNHEVLSISTVLANRFTGEFSSTPQSSIEKMILLSLAKIETL